MSTLGLRLPRADETEWLDQGRGTQIDVATNLDEMWGLNYWWGGMRALTRHLYPRLKAAGAPCTLIDLGTGSADVPLAIARWARAQGFALKVYGMDWAERNLAVARRRTNEGREVGLVLADMQDLPLAAQSADFIISSLFLHHFKPGPAAELLGAAYGAARRAVIMTDLVRGWVQWLSFALVQPAFARHALTRHDGALSIRRAYTPNELRVLAVEAGLPAARVHVHWPSHMTLVAERERHA